MGVEGGLVGVALHNSKLLASVLSWLLEFQDAPAEAIGVVGLDSLGIFLEGFEDDLLLTSCWSDKKHGGDLVGGVFHVRHFEILVGRVKGEFEVGFVSVVMKMMFSLEVTDVGLYI